MPINSNTTIDIAFASYNFGSNNSLGGMNNLTQSDLQWIVNYVHSKGGKVKISFGGATQPYWLSKSQDWPNVQKIAGEISSAINQYGFDGVDLDVEDNSAPDSNFANEVTQLLQQIKSLSPNVAISLTIPAQGWNTYWQALAQQAAPIVNTINFMEYDIWIAPGNTYAQQIQWDVNYYCQNWGIAPGKINLGLMPGMDDQQQDLSLQDATNLATWAKQTGLAGVMTWDLDRDYQGQDGNPSLAYTTAIENAILSIFNSDHFQVQQLTRGKNQKTFIQTSPPPETLDPSKMLREKKKKMIKKEMV